VYFSVGGTDAAYLRAAQNGSGPAVPSHHSPLFVIQPEPAVTTGIYATVLALLDLMARRD
jgi:hippurate hydrolase